jgi:transcriptional regulator with XRE-family HTH domain
MNVFRLLGWRVRFLRKAAGLTQEELAYRVGEVDQAYISELEHGKGNPTLQIIEAIANALQTSIASLFDTIDVPDSILKAPPRK